MRYYAPARYTGKTKQKRIFRIVLLTLLVLGILAGLAVLGNLLGDRLKRAQSLLSLTPDDYTAESGEHVSYGYEKAPEKRRLAFDGACAPLTADNITDGTVPAAEPPYGGLSFTVSDEHGRRFAIGAGEEDKQLLPLSLLSDTANAAAENGLHLSATVYTSYFAETDAETLKALAEHGIGEVVLCGLTGDTLDEKDAYTLLLYLERLRNAAPQTSIGLALAPALFKDPLAAPHLDTLYSYYDFLLLDLRRQNETDTLAAPPEETVAALYGSLSYYELAVLLDASYTDTAVLPALTEAGVKTVRWYEH